MIKSTSQLSLNSSHSTTQLAKKIQPQCLILSTEEDKDNSISNISRSKLLEWSIRLKSSAHQVPMRGSTLLIEWNTVFKMLSKTKNFWKMLLIKASCSEERTFKTNTRVLGTVTAEKDNTTLLCLIETEKLSRTSTKKFSLLCFLKSEHKFLQLNSKILGLALKIPIKTSQSTSMTKTRRKRFTSMKKLTMPRPTQSGQSSTSMKLRLTIVPISSMRCSFLRTRSSSKWRWTRNKPRIITAASPKALGCNFTRPNVLI